MDMGTLADILAALRRERTRLFAQYGLKSMAVFGSATRDDFRPDSDVDIMVEFEPGADFDYFDLLRDLQNIVQREVDLVMRTAVKPHYMEFIQKDLKYV
jgi:predicted nucleotidyltransferase